jgi:hypothetical protein
MILNLLSNQIIFIIKRELRAGLGNRQLASWNPEGLVEGFPGAVPKIALDNDRVSQYDDLEAKEKCGFLASGHRWLVDHRVCRS